MITVIGRVGKAPERLVYRDFRLERKGFLSILSYAIDGFAHRFDLMHRGHAVVILPVDFRRRELYMLAEIRPNRPFGLLKGGQDWLRKVFADAFTAKDETFEIPASQARICELPSGMIDVDKKTGESKETPEEAALRELKEETGLEVGIDRLKLVSSYFTTIGGSTEMIHAFIADLPEGCVEARLPAVGDGGEELDILRMSWDEAFGLVRDGKIETASSGLLLRELKILDLERRSEGKG